MPTSPVWKGALMVIAMNQFGTSLSTRVSGRAAYERIVEALASTGVVVFDFDGVGSVTNSFADEVFGRLVSERGIDYLRSRTTFRNIPPFWASVVRGAMDAREAQRRSVLAAV